MNRCRFPHWRSVALACSAAVRLQVAEYIMRIELVESFANIGGGKGGYWEDTSCEWCAGI